MQNDVYSFVFKGLLTESALDKTDRLSKHKLTAMMERAIGERLSLGLLDENFVLSARKMSIVYTAIFAFENSIREFIKKTLIEDKGDNWWEESVSERIRKKAESRQEEENKIRWHKPRGDSLINYTEFGDLTSIISINWSLFEPHLQSLEWVKQIITTVERSRNVIMHSGELVNEDIERIGTSIRDWIRQVGS
jgi:thymidylate synthase